MPGTSIKNNRTCAPGGGETILVCGGAGYIGSHMVRLLAENGYTPIIFDNLSTGHAEVLDSLRDPARPESGLPITLARGSLLDSQSLHRVFADYSIDAVMHFAGLIQVGESVLDPSKYYQNNVGGTANLLALMAEFNVRRLVFSSTCAVYGMPQPGIARLDENQPINPLTPYGHTKRMAEQMLMDCAAAYAISSMNLRYFNAAGAHPDGDLGEAHNPESHLIPNVLAAALGKGSLNVFGDDYPTPDGTCVRDYIHILDLCAAHLSALTFLREQKTPAAHFCNLGNGNGFSVLEVIRTAQEITGRNIPYDIMPRRPGDHPFLVGDSSLARRLLRWRPEYPTLAECIATAWRWHQHPRY